MSVLVSTLLTLAPNTSITVDVIPHLEQAYNTTGDWRWREGTLKVFVSNLGHPHFNTLVAAHEIVEALLCAAHGVSEESVTSFDVGHPELDEPGDDPRAPYHREHMLASAVERTLAQALGVDWDAYTDAFDALPEWGEEPHGEDDIP